MYFFKKYFLKTRGRMTKSLFNSNGMSTTEVLVAAGLMAVVSLGVVTMMQNSAIEQKRQTLFNTLKELQARIQFVVRDQGAWSNTINDNTLNPFLTCLANSAGCNLSGASAPTLTSPKKIILKDAANNTLFNLLDWAGSGSSGFTEGGASCNNFSGAASGGNDDCPISYRLVYGLSCTTGTTCNNPQFKVTARLFYNPSRNGYLYRFKSAIPMGSTTTTDDMATANVDGKYDVAIRRTAASVNRFFKLVMTVSGNGPGCLTAGAGICSTAGLTVHPLTWKVSAIEDTFSMLTAPTSATGATQYFQVKETGYYGCTASVTAFATMGFEAELYNQTANKSIAVAATVAGKWSQSSAMIDAKFDINDVTNSFIIRQKCDTNDPDGTGNASKCTLGMNNASNYSGGGDTVVVSLTCYRFDRNF